MIVKKTLKHLLAIFVPVILGITLISWSAPPMVPDFADYSAGPERKQAFFDYFLPLIEQRNQAILQTRDQLLSWNENRNDINWWNGFEIESLAEEYRIDDFDISDNEHWATLLRRVDIVPASLALAQAAKESGWGTSRFGREGYNYYGQWCYQPGCGMVPGQRDSGKKHEVAVFESPGESVENYIHNLNSHAAYRSLREIRANLRDAEKPVTGIDLASGLGKYSERRDAYIRELRSMINHNDLSQYDVALP